MKNLNFIPKGTDTEWIDLKRLENINLLLEFKFLLPNWVLGKSELIKFLGKMKKKSFNSLVAANQDYRRHRNEKTRFLKVHAHRAGISHRL